jgi:signal transduction histidine kinase
VRRQIQTLVLTAVVVAVALYAIPLAVMVRSATLADEHGELDRTALRAAAAVTPRFQQDPIELPPNEAGVAVAVYGVDGRRVVGAGPERLDDILRRALTGAALDATTPSDLISALPVTSGESVVAVVRAASPRSAVRARILSVWAGMAALALVAVVIAIAGSARQSRRLSRPLSDLAQAWTELGDGDFSARTRPSGVPEIDRAGEALNRTAARMAALIQRERAFSAHASHQLRTPLTALRLQLESGLDSPQRSSEPAIRAAIATADQLERTIEDVLELARSDGHPHRLDLDDVFDDLGRRWQGVLAAQDRPLQISTQDLRQRRAAASAAAVRQILDVLVDNAYRHGQGAVTVRARDAGGALAIDVLDEGRAADVGSLDPDPSKPSRRLGLPLAQHLAESQGGRLILTGHEGPTQFTLLLKRPKPHIDTADRVSAEA